jgi:hypothetical protein
MRRIPKSGLLYVFEADNGIYKLGCTTKKDVTDRLRYARSTFKLDFKIRLLTNRVSDVFRLENSMIWFMHENFCYFPLDHSSFNPKAHKSCEIFYDCFEHIKNFMSKKQIDYLEY